MKYFDEEALKQLDIHIGNAPFGYMQFVVDGDEIKLIYVNQRVCDYTGFTKEECMCDGKIEILQHERIIEAIRDVALDNIQMNMNVYVSQFHKDFDVCMYSFKKGIAVVSIKDNTKNFLFQNALYSTAPIFEEIFFINLRDDYFRKVYPFDNGLDGKFSELIKKRFDDDLIHKDHINDVKAVLVIDGIYEQLKTKEFIECKYKRLSSNGTYEWYILCITPINQMNGDFESVTLSTRCIDANEIKEIEKQNKLQEALKEAKSASIAKTTFLSTMSHDIRTPLNVILGMVNIAKKYITDLPRLENALDKIETSGKHLLTLVNEVLDMSKIESGKIEIAALDFSMPNLMTDTLNLLEGIVLSKKQNIYFDASNVIHENVIGDQNRLQQILINIIGNASKYTKPGGTIYVSISEKELDRPNYSLFTFIVKDTGIGMSKEYIEKIFEPFSREEDSRVSKIEGTGLGMSIALNLIKLMDGKINIESKQGVGTIVKIDIPIKIQDNPVELFKFTNESVLIVNGEELTGQAIKAMLEDLCAKTDCVNTCKAAMEYIENNNYSLVIIDCYMPEMNGLEFAKDLKRRFPSLNLMLIADYNKCSIREKALDLGINSVLTKPIFKSQLSKALNNIFKENKNENPTILNLNALLVEDNDLNVEIAVEFLKQLGVKCDIAKNGVEGLEMFKNSNINEYDCIFMDIEMPIMNGIIATQKIRSLTRADATNIPIFAMTANAFSSDVRMVKENGMTEHISKPISFSAIVKVLNKWFK
ncbi:MAG: response regulator [Anaeroplasma sp.]